ncbi:hypothetical protein GCM10008959_14220 [Deinococcus seoulensis]|uniref:Polymer-forming cytoskeletal protein n=1 Tax=Deinococcus seoulensis TaxID=1837379 RepID=A0ABQ2RP20_9DEIO|nr:polymer-forming cytoskeletal protein [Deinococcus seoulensis]GGR53869.1 hypothetical protein GCM10008959_14220 [Deinococcus seoulensis]
MGAERHNPASADAHRAWLDLLHQEADGTLDAAGQGVLARLENDPSGPPVRAWRRQLARGVTLVQSLPPPVLPVSVAALVVSEIQGSVWLAAPAPDLPASVAQAVATGVSLNRRLTPPPLPAGMSVAAAVGRDVSLRSALAPVPPLPVSVAALVAGEVSSSVRLGSVPPRPVPDGAGSMAAQLAARIAREAASGGPQSIQTGAGASAPLPFPAAHPGAQSVGSATSLGATSGATALGAVASGSAASGSAALRPEPFNPPDRPLRHNPAPLFMVVSLMVALTLMGVTSVWPNLAAGAVVAQALLAQVSPVAVAGLALLLVTSALVSWRPGPLTQRLGAGAFTLSAALTLPALYGVVSHGNVTFGQDLQVSGPVRGNVINVGGSVYLRPGAQVQGEVIALLGDVHRDAGAQVSGRVNALLGHAPDDRAALQTGAPQGLAAVTAAAFRPVLGWLGSAAWPQVFVTLTGGALLLLFVSGLAPMLARRQRHAPVRTLALGVLALAALLGPACGLTLAGLLGPALIALALTALLIALGLSVSAYDVGRALALRVRLPVPDAVGALIGLSAVAATLSAPPLAFALALVGGAWGAGTLLLTRGRPELLEVAQAA